MKKRLILVIDDNPELRDNTAELLELCGYEVLTAENGVDGLKIIHNHRPDIILCDVLMPEMDGIEMYSKMKKEEKIARIPFVFYSAYSKDDVEQKINEEGASFFLKKPFTEKDLLETINACLKVG